MSVVLCLTCIRIWIKLVFARLYLELPVKDTMEKTAKTHVEERACYWGETKS